MSTVDKLKNLTPNITANLAHINNMPVDVRTSAMTEAGMTDICIWLQRIHEELVVQRQATVRNAREK
jgi:hypothetical protein